MMTAQEQFERVVSTARFLRIAITDEGGPWLASVAYVIGPGPYLHFYSAKSSRHATALVSNSFCAISADYVTDDVVDGIQASAACEPIKPTELEAVASHYFETLFPDAVERADWERPISDFGPTGTWSFFQVSLIETFVYDQELFERSRVDGRRSVSESDARKVLLAAK